MDEVFERRLSKYEELVGEEGMVARGQGATVFLVECRDFAAKSLARAYSALGIEGETQQTIDEVEIFLKWLWH